MLFFRNDMMEAKLLILLFKILICTPLISFKSEGQSAKEPEEVKVFENYNDTVKLNSLEDNIDDEQAMQRKREYIKELEKFLQNLPKKQSEQFHKYSDQQIKRKLQIFENQEKISLDMLNRQSEHFNDTNVEQAMQRKRENIKELEKLIQNLPKPQTEQFDKYNDLKKIQKKLQIFENHEKIIQDMLNRQSEHFDDINGFMSERQKESEEMKILSEDAFKRQNLPLNDDDLYNIKPLSTQRVILHLVVLLLSVVLIIMGIVRCVKKKTTPSSPSHRRYLLWLKLKKKKDADQDESSGDGVGSQESSGDKTRLIV